MKRRLPGPPQIKFPTRKSTAGKVQAKAELEKEAGMFSNRDASDKAQEAKMYSFKEALPASSTVVHFWYMDVRRVGVRTFSSLILSTRESNTRSTGSLSSSS
jgi:hypothetical protein